MVEFLRDISPFLAILISFAALTVGPHITGSIARAQSIAQMREKWVYSFRELLIQLTTEFDMAPEVQDQDGVLFTRGAPVDWEYMRKLRSYQNSVLLMTNNDDPIHKQLAEAIEKVIHNIFHGIKDYSQLYEHIELVKLLGHKAIEQEWARISSK
ncbi:MAG: hypothetical protein ACOY4U_11320 [Pseudomonadota bacterium]